MNRIHLHVAVLVQIDDCLRIHHTLSSALTRTIVLLYIPHLRIFSDKKGMNAAVFTGLVTAVVNAAACHNRDITVLSNMKVIVHQLFESRLCHQHRNMHTFLFGAGLDENINSRLVLFGDNLNMLCGLPACRFTVCADVVSACGHFMQPRHLHQQCFLKLIHVYTLLHYVCTQDFRLIIWAESLPSTRSPESRRLQSPQFCLQSRECVPDAR